MSAVMLERADARSYLESVASGAAVLPLDEERERLVCSSLMAVMRPSFDPRISSADAGALFVAFLSHPGLSLRSLERVAMDGLCGHPDVFAALLGYPGLPDSLVVEAASTAWLQSAYFPPSRDTASPVAGISRLGHPMDLRDALVERLSSGGTAARLAALLLPAASSNDFFTCAYSVLSESAAVRDVAVQLVADDGWRRQALNPDRVRSYVERARLLVEA